MREFHLRVKEPQLNRAFVADDDPGVTQLITTILKQRGYEVVVAKDGREAYRILQGDAKFRVAILDMNMPFLQGLDLIHYMRSERRLMRIPIVMITGEQDLALLANSFAAGATVFLPKPFSPEQFENAICMLLGERNSLRLAS